MNGFSLPSLLTTVHYFGVKAFYLDIAKGINTFSVPKLLKKYGHYISSDRSAALKLFITIAEKAAKIVHNKSAVGISQPSRYGQGGGALSRRSPVCL